MGTLQQQFPHLQKAPDSLNIFFSCQICLFIMAVNMPCPLCHIVKVAHGAHV